MQYSNLIEYYIQYTNMLKIIYILFASLLAFTSNSNVIEKSKNSYFLTKVLSEGDLKIYKDVILYQKKYQWEKADRALLKVENPILVGHFQYEKLMHPNKYKASYKELSDWFRKNIDYPPVLRNRIYYFLDQTLVVNRLYLSILKYYYLLLT